MSFFKPLKNQSGALLLTVVFIMAVGAPVLYTTGRYMEHRRADIENVQDKLISGEDITEEEFGRAHSAIGDVATLAGASGSVLSSVSNIGVPDAGTAIGLVADTTIGEVVSRNTGPPATASRPLPADIPPPQQLMECTHYSLYNCTTRSNCTAAGGYWHSSNLCKSFPEPGCNENDLSRCLTQAACTGAGGAWYNNQCNEEFNSCTAESLALCFTESSCTAVGGHWYDGQCNQSPEACYTGSPELCANESDCLYADAYWYNNGCNAEPESDLVTVSMASPSSGTETNENQIVATASYMLHQPDTEISSAGFDINGSFQPAPLSENTFSTTAVLVTGENQIAAQVTTSTGATYTSTPITVISRATNNRYHIRITWDKDDTDVDLHFDWSGGDTCAYYNKTPNWGSPETSPRLDVDDTSGYGPENITIDSIPDTGDFRVYIRYFSDHGNGGTNVNATIYENGAPIVSESKYMTDGEEWTLLVF